VLSQLCFCTQRLSDILAVNGPRLEGPLHAGLCSATKSVVDQVSRDLEQLLGWSSLPPSLLPPPVHSSIGLEKDAVKSCVMSGSCLAVLEYALASIHAAPEQFACWVSATTQQAGTREALWRGACAASISMVCLLTDSMPCQRWRHPCATAILGTCQHSHPSTPTSSSSISPVL
jgi:hypothetical protein